LRAFKKEKIPLRGENIWSVQQIAYDDGGLGSLLPPSVNKPYIITINPAIVEHESDNTFQNQNWSKDYNWNKSDIKLFFTKKITQKINLIKNQLHFLSW
jgi:hypothetical protein